MFDPVPQLLKNVRFSGGKPLDDPRVQAVIAAAEKQLDGRGRLVIRPSGTEPVIRVMAEGDDREDGETVQHAHDGAHRRGLAAARFADQGQGLATLDREADAVDGVHELPRLAFDDAVEPGRGHVEDLG